MQSEDRIYNLFLHKTIFLTGGTGFVSQVLAERLLRLFDVDKIYMLIRPYKGKDGEERLSHILNSALFNAVREIKGEQILNKCVAVYGDMAMKNLGLSEADRLTLITETDYLVHSAALLKLDAPLDEAFELNVVGTKRTLKLAKDMKKLKAFIYISTAYLHPKIHILEEKLYDIVPKGFIEWLENRDNMELKFIKPKLLSGAENSYTFTKGLAEQLCKEALESENLPVLVIRPAIVMPIVGSPLPGWAQKYTISAWLIIGIGRGVIRTILTLKDSYGHFITADAVADSTFSCIAHYMENKEPKNVYNLWNNNNKSWDEFIQLVKYVSRYDIQFNAALWWPGVHIRSNRFCHYIVTVVGQLMPAVLIDILLRCLRYEPMMYKIQLFIAKAFYHFEFCTSNIWIILHDNMTEVRNWMNPREKATYITDMDNFDWRSYITSCIYSCRRYILNEPDSGIPAARSIMKLSVVFIKYLIEG